MDSPNVRLAMAQVARGMKPTGEMLVPGVLPYADYVKRRALWDKIRQTIGLDAEFWEGSDVLMYPPDWLNRANELWYKTPQQRRAKAIGVDPAEGGCSTSLSAADELGVIEVVSYQTPNTDDVPKLVKAFAQKHQVDPPNWLFDRGGGGKQHVDRLIAEGCYGVRTVAFGESVTDDPKRGKKLHAERIEERAERYVYTRRRSQMYGHLREVLDPTGGVDGVGGPKGFALPPPTVGEPYRKLREQLAPIPLQYDGEGRLDLPPKDRRGDAGAESTKVTLKDLIGYSPDEADSVVLSLHGVLYKGRRNVAGAC